MKGISTHVLDTSSGKPAGGVSVRLERQGADRRWQLLGTGRTGDDGRCAQLLPGDAMLSPGAYRLVFDTAQYFADRAIDGLYPVVQIEFTVRDGEPHFHIPLLLSPNGYTTYRGS